MQSEPTLANVNVSQLAFTFGIPLLPRSCAEDWSRVNELLGLTLRSVLAQSDADFRVLVACHDRPDRAIEDDRIQFLAAHWPVESVRPDNLDRGRKTALINRYVLETGGGLLMFIDADDWVDRQLVASARELIHQDVAAGVIETGYAIDHGSLRAAAIPDRHIFDEGFYRLCGSSVVLHLQPDSADAVRRDPNAVLHEHYRVRESAAERGAGIIGLPVSGAYLINTGENHSERHGPFADWRREFSRRVNAHGRPLTRELAGRFGVERAVWSSKVAAGPTAEHRGAETPRFG